MDVNNPLKMVLIGIDPYPINQPGPTFVRWLTLSTTQWSCEDVEERMHWIFPFFDETGRWVNWVNIIWLVVDLPL